MNKDYYQQLEEYLTGNLPDSERIDVETALQNDPMLRKALEDLILAKQLAESLIELETRNQLQAIHSKSAKKFWTWVFVAVLVLLMLAVYIFYPQNDVQEAAQTPEQIFAMLYEPPAATSLRNTTDLKNTLDSAIFYFDQGQYQNSEYLFQLLYSADSLNAITNRYLGHLALYHKNYKKAKGYFQQVYTSAQEPLSSEALYLLCVLALLNDDMQLAKSLFERLQQSPHLPAPNKMVWLEHQIKK